MLSRAFFVMGFFAFVDCKCEDRVRSAVDERRQDPSTQKTGSGPLQDVPNNTPERATPIELGQELRAWKAEISPSDIDWYALSTSVADIESIELRVVPASDVNVSLHLEVANAAIPASYDVAGPGEVESVAVLRVGRQPLRFAVRASQGSGEYTLEFARRLGGSALEAEPNDDVAVAVDLAIPADIQGLVDRPDDRDVFRVLPADAQRRLRIDFEPVQGVTQVLRVFDTDRFETPLVAMQFAGAVGERGSIPAFEIPAGQPLYAVVTTTGGFDRRAPYRLATRPLEDVSDAVEVEPNDRKPWSIAVPGVTRGVFYATEDVDRFMLGHVPDGVALPVDAGIEDSMQPNPTAPMADAGFGDAASHERDGGLEEPVSFAFVDKAPPVPPVRVKVELLQTSDVLGVSLNTTAGERTQVLDAQTPVQEFCLPGFRPGEVEVTLRPVQIAGDRKGFDYVIETTTMAGSTLEGEPNDSIAMADELAEARQGFLERPDDTDVFGFMVRTEGVQSVAWEVEGHGAFQLELVDENDGLIATAAQGAKARVVADLPTGVYFLKVRGRADGCAAYTVKRLP